MIRRITTLLILFVVSPALPSAGREAGREAEDLPAAPDVPPILYANLDHVDPTYPIFVSAEAMVLPSGALDLDLFHPHHRAGVETILNSVPPGLGKCVEWGPDYQAFMDPPRRDSIAAAVKTSDLVLSGRIVARQVGLDRSTPGQLLVVEPSEAFRGELALDHYYFFVPVGEFTAGPFRICKTDPRYPEPPEIGEDVVLMVPDAPSADEPYLDLQFDTSFVVFDRDGTARLPRALMAGEKRLDNAVSRRSILERVRSAVQELNDPD